MAVAIAKPDTHRREYAYVQLPNNLKAVVASDPACDMAGAALTVNVGLCYERKDLPGLAHFLEHMLCTATKKYPNESEYREYIKQNGGMSNASTTCYATNFMFQVKPEVLEEALDRFACFFTEPLLTRDCTEREINAVDSEFQAGHTLPWWRYIGIMHMSANPEHPFHVAVGNNKVLRDEPKERGIDLYEEMLKFYSEFYSANGMTLCVIGKESLDELEALVREKFSAVVDKGLELPLGSAVSDKPPFLPQDWNRLLLQCPVKDVKHLTFSWVLPYQAPLWRSKPTSYITHLLGHESKGSFTAVLKDRGVISGCTASGGGWLEGAFSLLHVRFDLTDKGLFEVQQIGTLLFAYLAMLRKSEVKQWIFEELQKLRQVNFRFGNDHTPFNLAALVAQSLQLHPPSEVLAGGSLLYEPDAAATAAILQQLSLDTVRVTHQAKALEGRCTERDTSYDSPMKFEPLPPEWLAAWSGALQCASAEQAVAAAAASGLHFPEPNPFIPEDLALKVSPPAPVPLPLRLPGARPPIGYIFHRQDDVFRQPKAVITFFIRSPYVCRDAESYLKVDLWSSIVTEALAEYAYDASVAGVRYGLEVSFGGLMLAFGGFHDKLGVLIEAVAAKMREMTSAPENLYQIAADMYGDHLRNACFHSRPLAQCSMRCMDLINRGTGFPLEDLYRAFSGLEPESLDGVCTEVLRTCHVEAMALGNLTGADVEALAGTLSASLGLEGCMHSLPEQAEAALPPGRTLWNLDSTDRDDPNHAVMMYLQLGRGVEEQATLLVLGKVLSPKFYAVLRTQKQLGYIVGMGSMARMAFTYIVAQVQTEYPPDYARSCADAFFDEHFAWIEDGLTDEELQTCRAGVLSELRMKPKNLNEENASYLREFMYRSYDFGRKERLIEHLERGMTLEALRIFVREHVRPAPRLYVQVRKVLQKEDKPLPEGASLPEDPPNLRCWNGPEAAADDFKSTARWTPINGIIEYPALA